MIVNRILVGKRIAPRNPEMLWVELGATLSGQPEMSLMVYRGSSLGQAELGKTVQVTLDVKID